jgi:hypothetical protein
LIIALFPALTLSLDFQSSECEDVYTFPKILGKNGTSAEYYPYNVQYNAQSDRTAVSIYNYRAESQTCQGSYTCHTIAMY